MKQVLLKDLKKGEWFTLKPIEEPNEMQVYVKDDYYRPEKVFICYKYGDVCYSRDFKGDRKVYTDFIF